MGERRARQSAAPPLSDWRIWTTSTTVINCATSSASSVSEVSSPTLRDRQLLRCFVSFVEELGNSSESNRFGQKFVFSDGDERYRVPATHVVASLWFVYKIFRLHTYLPSLWVLPVTVRGWYQLFPGTSNSWRRPVVHCGALELSHWQTLISEFSSISNVRTRRLKYLSTGLVWALGVKEQIFFTFSYFRQYKKKRTWLLWS